MQYLKEVIKESYKQAAINNIKWGNSKAEEGDWKRAAEYYGMAKHLDPNSITAHYKHGIAYINLGYFAQAETCFDNVIRLDPADPEGYNCRGHCRNMQGYYDQAIADFDEAIRVQPTFNIAYLNRAKIKYKKKDYVGAIADMNKAIELNPVDIEAYNTRASYKQENKDYDGAILDFDKAIELHQQKVKELSGRELKEDGFEQNKVTELNQQAAAFYHNRETVKRYKGDIDGAIADINEAIRLCPTIFIMHSELALLRQKKGDYDGAIAAYSEAIRLEPNAAIDFFDRGKCKFVKGDFAGAQADHREALRVLPTFLNTYNTIGDPEIQKFPDDYLNPQQKLWRAASAGDIDGIKALSTTVNLDAQDVNGGTALHYAAASGQVKLIPLLYMNYDIPDKVGDTPIRVAAKCKKTEMVKGLLDKGVKLEGVLHAMVAAGHKDMLQHFLTTPSHYRDSLLGACPEGIRALVRTAIQAKQPEILRFLIEYEPRCRNELYDQQGVFHEAVMSENEEAMDVLFEQYIDPSQSNELGQTPAQLVSQLSAKHREKEALLKKLTAKLAHLINLRKIQNGNLSKNIREVIDTLEKQLSTSKDWNFLLKNNGKRRTLFENVIQDYLSKDLFCQKLLSAPNPNTSTLISTLKESIIQAQSKLLKISKITSNELLEAPLRQTVEEALRTLNVPDEKSELVVETIKESINSSAQPLDKAKKLDSEPEAKTGAKAHNSVFKSLTREQEEFVNQFEQEFDSAYSQFAALRTGKVIYAPDGADHAAQLAKTAAEALPNVSVGVPYVPGVSIAIPTGKVVGATIDIGMYFRNRWRKDKAERMCALFEGCTPGERQQIIHLAAICIAEKYRFQLAHLQSGSDGVSHFATCAAQRVIDYIISADTHQIQQEATKMDRIGRWIKSCWSGAEIPSKLTVKKSLLSVFLDGMLRVTNYPGDNRQLRTVSGLTFDDHWTSKGIIENTGVLTPEGEHFAHPDCLIDNYGYVYGTKEEAERRGLTGLNPTGKPWGAGRSWEAYQGSSDTVTFHGRAATASSLAAAAQSGITFTSGGQFSSSSRSQADPKKLSSSEVAATMK